MVFLTDLFVFLAYSAENSGVFTHRLEAGNMEIQYRIEVESVAGILFHSA